MSGLRVSYASATAGVHDERWIGALRSLGADVSAVTLGDVADICAGTLPSRLAPDVLLAGPLWPTDWLPSDARLPIIGVSWGWDLQHLPAECLGPLRRLAAILIDSPANLAPAHALNLPFLSMPWGLDLQSFELRTAQRARRQRRPAERKRAVILRAHEPIYHVQDAVAALASLREQGVELELTIGNTGSLTPLLMRQAAASGHGDHINFVGRLTESQVLRLLASADVYVSTSEVDGTSITLLQAMAVGVPVAVTDIPGNRTWVQNGSTGYLYPVGNTELLERALQLAIEAPTGMTKAARGLVERDANWIANVEQRLAPFMLSVIDRHAQFAKPNK